MPKTFLFLSADLEYFYKGIASFCAIISSKFIKIICDEKDCNEIFQGACLVYTLNFLKVFPPISTRNGNLNKHCNERI